MNKSDGIIQIHGKDYKTVAQRVLEAKDELLAVKTEIIPFEGHVVVKASVYLKDDRMFEGTSAVNLNANKLIEKENPFEVAETSAVGRALGFAGYGVIESVASADEMVRATRPTTSPVKPQQTKPSIKEEIHQDMENTTKKENTIECDMCGHRVSDKVASFSDGKYGKILCFDCQKLMK